MNRSAVFAALVLLLCHATADTRKGTNDTLTRIDRRFSIATGLMMRIRVVRCPHSSPVHIETVRYFRRAIPPAELFLTVASKNDRGASLLILPDDVSVLGPEAGFFPLKAEDIRDDLVYLAMMMINGRLETDFICGAESWSREGGKLTMVLRSRRADFPYATIDCTIDVAHDLPVEAVYRTEDGKAAYTFRFREWVERDGVCFPGKIHVMGHGIGATVFSIVFDRLTVAPLPEYIFTRAYCEYAAK